MTRSGSYPSGSRPGEDRAGDSRSAGREAEGDGRTGEADQDPDSLGREHARRLDQGSRRLDAPVQETGRGRLAKPVAGRFWPRFCARSSSGSAGRLTSSPVDARRSEPESPAVGLQLATSRAACETFPRRGGPALLLVPPCCPARHDSMTSTPSISPRARATRSVCHSTSVAPAANGTRSSRPGTCR